MHSSTMKVRASQDKMLKEPFKPDEVGDVSLQEQTNKHDFNPLETNKQ